MADNERSSSAPHSGLPKVSPEAIKAFNEQPHDFNENFEWLRRTNPHIAHDLTVGYVAVDPHYMERKRAFAAGVLWALRLMNGAVEARDLEEMMAASRDGDDEDRPLSA